MTGTTEQHSVYNWKTMPDGVTQIRRDSGSRIEARRWNIELVRDVSALTGRELPYAPLSMEEVIDLCEDGIKFRMLAQAKAIEKQIQNQLTAVAATPA
ncbi:hypothetical protein HY493_04870 [Candidatus Woesearchaeota archaeon]|nr:hypothetical protein [Candidatus Woesearchaeota archaeon]